MNVYRLQDMAWAYSIIPDAVATSAHHAHALERKAGLIVSSWRQALREWEALLKVHILLMIAMIPEVTCAAVVKD